MLKIIFIALFVINSFGQYRAYTSDSSYGNVGYSGQQCGFCGSEPQVPVNNFRYRTGTLQTNKCNVCGNSVGTPVNSCPICAAKKATGALQQTCGSECTGCALCRSNAGFGTGGQLSGIGYGTDVGYGSGSQLTNGGCSKCGRQSSGGLSTGGGYDSSAGYGSGNQLSNGGYSKCGRQSSGGLSTGGGYGSNAGYGTGGGYGSGSQLSSGGYNTGVGYGSSGGYGSNGYSSSYQSSYGSVAPGSSKG